MLRFRLIAILVFGVAGAGLGAAIAEEQTCYSKAEQRALLAGQKVIPLAQAMRSLPADQKDEVLRARLCQGVRGEPVYVLTLLPHNGKVTHTAIDATNGTLISGR